MNSIIRTEFFTPPPACPANTPPESTLGKRKYKDAFENNHFEHERYGQDIYAHFFTISVGHNVDK